MLTSSTKTSNRAFDEYTSSLLAIAKEHQRNQREHITEEIAIMAAYCVKNMAIISEYDVVLFLTALNVCNTYVKQKDHAPSFSYRFKQHISSISNAVVSNDIQSVRFDIQIDKGMTVTLVQAGNIQFSFHQIPYASSEFGLLKDNALISALSWDQVYKQNCAHSLFCVALSCGDNSNETFRGENLEMKLSRQISNYRSGQLNVAELFAF